MRRLFEDVIVHRDEFLIEWERIMGDTKVLADVTNAQLDAAEARGRALMEREPRAVSARYEAQTGRVVIDLVNGCIYAFPASMVEDLSGASPADLAGIDVDGQGFNLHWSALDVDLYVPALVAGLFGTRAWMRREMARAAGRTTSPAKASAARTNGAKGGRPRKVAS